MKKPKAKPMTDEQFWRAMDAACTRLQHAYVDLEDVVFQATEEREECERKKREAAA